jgi:hypothetical protein
MCIVRRAVGVAVASAALIALLWCSAAVEARDVVMTSFDGTPIAAHFYPAVGLDPGELAPTVLVGPGWATVGDTSPDANLGDRIDTSNLRTRATAAGSRHSRSRGSACAPPRDLRPGWPRRGTQQATSPRLQEGTTS